MINKIFLNFILKKYLIIILLLIPSCSLLKEQYQRLPAEAEDIPLENIVLQKRGSAEANREVAGWVVWVDGNMILVRLNEGVRMKEGVYLHAYSSYPVEDAHGTYKGMLRVKRILREGVIETERIRGIDIPGLFKPSVMPGDIVLDKKK